MNWNDAALEGQVLNEEYRVTTKLGQGGMAWVYQGERLATGELVAIKILSSFAANDEDKRERFLQEARLQCQLEHPHIVKVYDLLTSPTQPPLCGIVMEWCPGGDLFDWFRARHQQPLELHHISSMYLPLLDGLAHAHQHGIVHRDLKPQNVLLVPSENGLLPKIADFGVAKALHEEGRTSTGATIGTIRYMAPEQLEDSKRATASADIYSMGAMLYYLCTGRHAFDATGPVLIQQILNEPPKVPTEASPALRSVLLRCLERDPAHRYPNALALKKALVQALEKDKATKPQPAFAFAAQTPHVQRDAPTIDSINRYDSTNGVDSLDSTNGVEPIEVTEFTQEASLDSIPTTLQPAAQSPGVAPWDRAWGLSLLLLVLLPGIVLLSQSWGTRKETSRAQSPPKERSHTVPIRRRARRTVHRSNKAPDTHKIVVQARLSEIFTLATIASEHKDVRLGHRILVSNRHLRREAWALLRDLCEHKNKNVGRACSVLATKDTSLTSQEARRLLARGVHLQDGESSLQLGLRNAGHRWRMSETDRPKLACQHFYRSCQVGYRVGCVWFNDMPCGPKALPLPSGHEDPAFRRFESATVKASFSISLEIIHHLVWSYLEKGKSEGFILGHKACEKGARIACRYVARFLASSEPKKAIQYYKSSCRLRDLSSCESLYLIYKGRGKVIQRETQLAKSCHYLRILCRLAPRRGACSSEALATCAPLTRSKRPQRSGPALPR